MASGTGSSREMDTQTAIMEATYRALCEHGYADLTIDTINAEFEKSKSLLYYHYDDKDEILLNLLGYLLDQFTVEEAVDLDDDPDIQLRTFVEWLLPWTIDDNERELQIALLELRSQALSDEAYSEQFTRADALLKGTIVDLIEEGIEEEIFRAVNADRAAEHVLSTINGAMVRRHTAEDESAVRTTRKGLEEYIESYLIPDDN
ncbi:TetR/AcrR family transcriptional regulator [Halobacteriales archaeon QS_3_64_16]|nr:MAG: TetR/AcrR family transcriptional regulator [Halobacteriales archaeon QS_3_64_16]